jgi:hypothetical protein
VENLLKTKWIKCGKLFDLPAFAHSLKRPDDLVGELILARKDRALCQAKSLFIIRFNEGRDNFLGKIFA